MSGQPDRLDRMLELVRSHRPGLRLVDRHDVWWMRLPGDLVRPVLPGINERFTTVIGDTVFLPAPVEALDRDVLARTLAHELVHQLDQARWGPLFYASYVLLPAGRTARAEWERRAYAVDMLLTYDQGGESALRLLLLRLTEIFAGRSYGFMWTGRRSARRYLERTAARVRDGTLAELQPYASILAAWRGSDPESPCPLRE